MTGVEIKEPRKFTRDNPCTKVELWLCFHAGPDFARRPVVTARGEIGLHAPKYLLKQGYMRMYSERGIDYYELTDEGREWLRGGLVQFLLKHPHRAREIQYPPEQQKPAIARRLRSR